MHARAGCETKPSFLIPHTSTYTYAAHHVLEHFLRLSNKRWFNDEVLNALIELLNARARFLACASLPACLILNTFFYVKLAE